MVLIYSSQRREDAEKDSHKKAQKSQKTAQKHFFCVFVLFRGYHLFLSASPCGAVNHCRFNQF
jgi:primosomal protein N'